MLNEDNKVECILSLPGGVWERILLISGLAYHFWNNFEIIYEKINAFWSVFMINKFWTSTFIFLRPLYHSVLFIHNATMHLKRFYQ